MFPLTENVLAIALALFLIYQIVLLYRKYASYVSGTEQTVLTFSKGEEVEYRRSGGSKKREAMKVFLILSGVYLGVVLPFCTELLMMVDYRKLVTLGPDFVKSFAAFTVVAAFTAVNWMALCQWVVLAFRCKKVTTIIRKRKEGN